MDAPTEKLPLFAREGAILPLRDYAPSIEAGGNDPRTCEIFPGPRPSAFVLREDDGRSNDYLAGRSAATGLRTAPTTGGVRLGILPVVGDLLAWPHSANGWPDFTASHRRKP